jgi:hypothetical protein
MIRNPNLFTVIDSVSAFLADFSSSGFHLYSGKETVERAHSRLGEGENKIPVKAWYKVFGSKYRRHVGKPMRAVLKSKNLAQPSRGLEYLPGQDQPHWKQCEPVQKPLKKLCGYCVKFLHGAQCQQVKKRTGSFSLADGLNSAKMYKKYTVLAEKIPKIQSQILNLLTLCDASRKLKKKIRGSWASYLFYSPKSCS